MSPGFIPQHGGYRDLLAYQKAEAIYDATVYFCSRFIDPKSRTRDQMVQAARSGKQNIAEGSMASGTSKETEIKLMNVARASLEELLVDYKDYLRVNGLPVWDKNSPEACRIRSIRPQANDNHKSHGSYETYRTYIEAVTAGDAANAILCLIHQANYLLDRLIRQLEEAFVREGGLRERMTRARLDARNRPK